jgi:hypothetical protein
MFPILSDCASFVGVSHWHEELSLMQEANVQQITGRSFVSPSSDRMNQQVHVDNSNCNVMWNQNDMFKNDATSLSSGGRRAADCSATVQVCLLSSVPLAHRCMFGGSIVKFQHLAARDQNQDVPPLITHCCMHACRRRRLHRACSTSHHRNHCGM